MKKQNIRTLSLVVITLTYLIIGAAVFDHFESDNEHRQKTRLQQNITAFRHRYNMNETEFNRLWHKMLEKKPYQAGNQWKFVGSLYFCTVVVTLIGYGHSTPRTVAGKCFCIFYTLIGIPIFLIMFQSVGERLNSLIVFFLTRFKRRLKLKNQEVGLFELISIEFFLTMTITLVASYVFMNNEEWTYFDAMYYCFITLTTIGFGDFVPLQKNNFLSNNFAYACFTILFILIGLTTLASSMNLLVLRLATINAEEAVQERREAAEARRNAVHLEGDVIQPNTRLFNTTEKPEQVETISVCSCACLDYKIWHHSHAIQHQTPPLNSQQMTIKSKKSTSIIYESNQRRRSSVGRKRIKTENWTALSDATVEGINRRNSWRQRFFKRFLPSRLMLQQRFIGCQHKHQENIIVNIPNSNEFEMVNKLERCEPVVTQITTPENKKKVVETNLLNLDAINVCSSNVKRNSI